MLHCCHRLEGFAVVTPPWWQGNMLDGMGRAAHDRAWGFSGSHRTSHELLPLPLQILRLEMVPFGGNVSEPVHIQCRGLARQTLVREAAKPDPFLSPHLSMVGPAL